MTRLPAWVDYGVLPLINISLSLLVAGFVIILAGENPVEALGVMVNGAFVYSGSLGYTLYYATSLTFAGLAVAVAFKVQLLNIGGEGQAYIGALGAFLVCFAIDAWAPGFVVIPLAIAGAAAFGALWAMIPGFLQAYRGSHVVITTIMFNFIASGVMVWLLAGLLKNPGRPSPETRPIAETAMVPPLQGMLEPFGLDIGSSPLNASLFLAAIACVGVWALIWRTRWGYAMRTLGESEDAAQYAGVNVRRTYFAAMLLSGALAGLMAVNILLGSQGKITVDLPAGFGFTGIAVALMGRGHPAGIALSALLFGALFQGGTELDFEYSTISREMAIFIQGLIVLFSGALAYMFVPTMTRIFAQTARG